MNKTKALVLTALCIAMGIVLPMAFHGVPSAGTIFLPMHIPVLLCGLITGPVFGLICGIFTPFLSSVLTGMPPAAILPGMLCELAIYGLVGGLLRKVIKTGKLPVDVMLSLTGAMICGRIASGILNALVFRAGAYSLQIWLAASFTKALPGIVMQLIIIPIVVIALNKAKLIRWEE